MKKARLVAAAVALSLIALLCACPSPTTTTPTTSTTGGTTSTPATPAAPATPTTTITQSSTLPAPPSAVAADDAAATGVYKGVLAATEVSGGYWFKVSNSTNVSSSLRATGSTKTAQFVILVAGTLVQTTAEVTGSSPYHVSASATINSKLLKIEFDVTDAGVVSNIKLTLNGTVVPDGATLAKETTTAGVSTWTGTFSGSGSKDYSGFLSTNNSQGYWNFVISSDGSKASIKGAFAGKAVATTPTGSLTTALGGSYSGSITTLGSLNFATSPHVTGSYSGSSASGTWDWPSDGERGSGTWSGTKIN